MIMAIAIYELIQQTDTYHVIVYLTRFYLHSLPPLATTCIMMQPTTTLP